MRGTKAKALRRSAGYKSGTTVSYEYQDRMVTKEKLVRQTGPFGIPKMVKKVFTQREATGAVICAGPRKIYKMLKGMAKHV